MGKSIFLGYNNVTTGYCSFTEIDEKDFIGGRNLALNLQKRKKPDHSFGISQLIDVTSNKKMPLENKKTCVQATITVVMVDQDQYCKDSNLYVLRVDQENKDFYLSALETNSKNYESNQEIFKQICSTGYDEYNQWVNDRLSKDSLKNNLVESE